MNIKLSLFCFLPMLFLASCGGVREKSAIHLDAPAAADLVQSESAVVVIDVRTPEEFASGSIKGARNLDIKSSAFILQVEKLNPQAPYLIYCRSGNRSAQALKVFEQENFTKIYHLDGGVKAWKQAGLKLEQ